MLYSLCTNQQDVAPTLEEGRARSDPSLNGQAVTLFQALILQLEQHFRTQKDTLNPFLNCHSKVQLSL